MTNEANSCKRISPKTAFSSVYAAFLSAHSSQKGRESNPQVRNNAVHRPKVSLVPVLKPDRDRTFFQITTPVLCFELYKIMVQKRRRVSYIIPSPSESIPRLQLPPHGISRVGATGPLLTPFAGQSGSESDSKRSNHPRHRLGVASLTLDISTQLAGRAAPEGILYSGGRDGLVMSWDLGLPTKRRKVKAGHLMKIGQDRWGAMTGWEDDILDEYLDDGDERVNDGDVLGDVTDNLHRRRLRARSKAGEIPFELEWELDLSTFRAGTVCDLLLFFDL